MLNMHFWRMYDTDDAQDQQLVWGTPSTFTAKTYYFVDGGASAESDVFEVMTLSALSGIAAASLAIVAAMLC